MTSLVKLAAKSVTLPMTHLKADHKELEDMKRNATAILFKVKEMEADDAAAKKSEMGK